MTLLKASQSGPGAIVGYRFSQGAKAVGEVGVLAKGVKGTADTAIATSSDGEDLVAKLNRQIQALETELTKTREQAIEDREAAHNAGREQGLADALKQDQERLEILRQSAEKAHADVLAGLENHTGLAIEIARTTLSRILGDQNASSKLVEETALHWKKQLTGKMILRARVSAVDFPDQAAAAELQRKLGKTTIEVDPEMDAGGCIFELQLGRVDASIPLQATAADAALAEHSRSQVEK